MKQSLPKTPTTPFGSTRPTTGSVRIDQAILEEIESLKKVLVIQTDENARAQKHIIMLAGEIDALKEVVEKKQKVINTRDEEIFSLKETIKGLELKLKEALMDRTAFNVFEDQNDALLKRLLQKQKEAENLQEELNKLKASQDDIRAYGDNKVKNAVQVEVTMAATIMQLKHQCEKDHEARVAAMQEAAKSKLRAEELEKQLKLSEELRSELVYRSRTTEYSTLRRIDELSLQLQQARDDKNQLNETVSLATFRGDLLNERLDKAIETSQVNQEFFKEVINDIENQQDLVLARDKKLRREHEIMQARLQLTQKAYNELLIKVRRMETIDKYTNGSFKGVVTIKKEDRDYEKHVSAFNLDKLKADAVISQSILNTSEIGNLNVSSITSYKLDDEDFEQVRSTVVKDSSDTILGKVSGVNSLSGTVSSPSRMEQSGGGEVLTINVDDQLSAGKSSLLSNYLTHLTAILNSSDISTRCKPDVIELGRCAINDKDMIHAIEWFRLISLKNIKKIDLRQNLISSVGLDAIAVWILAIPGSELRRDNPLEINLNHNLISKTAVRNFVAKIRANSRPEIHLVQDDDEATSITIFGGKETGLPTLPSRTKDADNEGLVVFREEPTVIVIKIELRHNKTKKKNQHNDPFRKDRKNKITLVSPQPQNETLELDLIMNNLDQTTIYPRDHLFE